MFSSGLKFHGGMSFRLGMKETFLFIFCCDIGRSIFRNIPRKFSLLVLWFRYLFCNELLIFFLALILHGQWLFNYDQVKQIAFLSVFLHLSHKLLTWVLLVNTSTQKQNYNQHRKYQISVLNVLEAHGKDTRVTSVDIILVSLLLTVNTFMLKFSTLI